MNEEKKAIAEDIFYMFDQGHITHVEALTAMADLLQEMIDAEQAAGVPDDEPVAAQSRYMAVKAGLPSYGNSGFGPWQPAPMPKEGALLKGVDSVGYAYEIRLLYAAPQAPAVQETWPIELCEKTLSTLTYIRGIAERGEGRPMRDDETLEQFLLGYVKRLEAPAVQADQSEHHLEMVNAPAPSVTGEELQAAFDRGLKAGNEQNDAQQVEIHRLHDLIAAAPTPAEAPADVVRDAARYRWLRTYNTAKHPAVTEAFFLGDESLDAEIDAAIAAEKGGA